MRNRVALLALTLFMLFVTVGCSGGSYSISVGEIDSNKSSITGEYQNFSGFYYQTVKLSEGETIHFQYASTTEGGSLQAKLFDPQGNELISIEDETVFVVTEAGKYKVQVEGTQHQGLFQLIWQID